MKRTLLTSAAAGAALCVAASASFAASVSSKQHPYRTNGTQLLAQGPYGQVVTPAPATHGAAAHGHHQAKRSRTGAAPAALCEPPGQLGDPRGRWEGYPGWRWDGDPRWKWDGYPRWLWHGRDHTAGQVEPA